VLTRPAGCVEAQHGLYFGMPPAAATPLTHAHSPPHTTQVCRYVVYSDWVEKLVPAGGRVLVSDVRDVFFQSDPFESSQPDAAATLAGPGLGSAGAQLLVFEETRGSRAHANLYTSKLNRAWITAAYSGDPLNLAARRDLWVLCSGTTLGTRAGMLEYTLRQQAEMGLCRRRQKQRGGGGRCVEMPLPALCGFTRAQREVREGDNLGDCLSIRHFRRAHTGRCAGYSLGERS
jgi:hypothetical protein